MGAGASKGLDRIQMLKATESPRFLMNQILQFILEEISDKDVFRLQDPQVCQSFVVLTASSLKKYFDAIDLYPTKDEQNRLYFRRISELTKPQSKQLAEQTQDNCTALGYFYIRILQIYIALALSLIDDPKLVPGRIEYKDTDMSRSRRPLAPGARIRGGGTGGSSSEGAEDELYPKMKYIGQGGAELDPITFYDLIDERILQESIGSEARGRQGIKYAFVEKPQIIVKPSTETTGVVMEEGIIDNISVRRQPGRYDYNNDYSYDRSGSRGKRPAIGIRFIIEDQQSIMQIPEISVAGGRQPLIPPISITLNEQFNPTDYHVGRTLAEFFDRVLQELQTTRKSRTLEILRQQPQHQQVRRRDAIPLTASRAVPALDFSQNIQALAAKPLAHCIARSFQLLNIDALGPKVPKSAVTHICETKFKDNIVVPGAGESIARIPGVHALNFLFFVLDKTPKLTDRTREEYALSLSALSKAFSGNPRVYEIGDSELKDGSKAIETVRATAAPCKKRGDQIIGESAAKVARAGVTSLWSFQRAHAERVEKIFRQLFSIDKTGEISFNDFVFQNGIAGVNAIAAEARAVLVEYYSRCEEIYQTTVTQMATDL